MSGALTTSSFGIPRAWRLCPAMSSALTTKSFVDLACLGASIDKLFVSCFLLFASGLRLLLHLRIAFAVSFTLQGT